MWAEWPAASPAPLCPPLGPRGPACCPVAQGAASACGPHNVPSGRVDEKPSFPGRHPPPLAGTALDAPSEGPWVIGRVTCPGSSPPGLPVSVLPFRRPQKMGSEQTQAWDARGPGALLFKGAPLTRRAAGPRGGAVCSPGGQAQARKDSPSLPAPACPCTRGTLMAQSLSPPLPPLPPPPPTRPSLRPPVLLPSAPEAGMV